MTEVGVSFVRALEALLAVGSADDPLAEFECKCDDIQRLPSALASPQAPSSSDRGSRRHPLGAAAAAAAAQREFEVACEQLRQPTMALSLAHVLKRTMECLELAAGTTKFFQVPERVRACMTLLLNRLEECVMECVDHTPKSEKAAVQELLADKIDRAAVMPQLVTACTSMSKALKQHRDDSQLRQLADFSAGLLHAWHGIVFCWPGSVITGTQNPIVDIIQPGATLAASVLQVLGPAAGTGSGRGPDGSSNRSISSYQHAVRSAMRAVVLFAENINISGELSSWRLPQDKALVLQLLQDGDVQLQLLAYMGTAAQELHTRMQGRTAASAAAMLPRLATSQQQQQGRQQQLQLQDVEPRHLELLKAIGLSALSNAQAIQPFAELPAALEAKDAIAGVFAVVFQLQAAMHQKILQGPVTAGTSSGSRQRQRRQHASDDNDVHYFEVGHVLAPNVCRLLQLVLVELMQLVPTINMAEPVLQLLQILQDVQSQAAVQSTREQGLPAGLIAAAVSNEAGKVLQPLLHLLAPPVMHAIRLSRRQAAANTAGTQQQQQQQAAVDDDDVGEDSDPFLPNCFAGVIIRSSLVVAIGDLARAIAAEPITSSIVLESALRLQAHAEREQLPGVLPANKLPPNAAQPSDRLLVVAYKCATAVGEAGTATAAAPEQQQLLQVSLLLSCLKYCLHAAKGTSTAQLLSLLEVLEVASMVVHVGVKGGRRGSSGPNAAWWMVLVSRGLAVLGKVLLKAFEHSERLRGAMLRMQDNTSTGNAQQLLLRISTAVEWLGEQLQQQGLPCTDEAEAETAGGEAAAKAAAEGKAVLQQLLQQQAELLQRLEDAEVKVAADLAATGNTTPPLVPQAKRVMGSQLALQLQQFGEAVCAQLPVWHCCNNPGCSNMVRRSELQLARAARCTGCKAVRYCTRDCQVQHWKAGHKAVCKRLAAAKYKG